MSSDGRGGITAPGAKGQALALRRAYERAGYGADTLHFIEGHGTGTPAGDRAELEGMAIALQARGTMPGRNCGVTSFKSLVGHTKAAAGVGGFIKTVLAVNRRVLPPTDGCREPNGVFDSTGQSLYPLTRGAVWSASERLRAGVTAAGFGGINCHVTVESGDPPSERFAPSIDERALLVSRQQTELFVLAGPSVGTLLDRLRVLRQAARGMSLGELTDLAARTGSDLGDDRILRAAVVAGTPDELTDCLLALERRLGRELPEEGVVSAAEGRVRVGRGRRGPRIGFLFPGQGAQRLNMARTLVERFDWAQRLAAEGDAAFGGDQGTRPLSGLMFRPTERAANQGEIAQWLGDLTQTQAAQPAVCLASLLWLRRLGGLGVRAAAFAGHSLGELTAFHAAGAYDELTLLLAAACRGRAMADGLGSAGGAGAMAALGCSAAEAAAILADAGGYVVVANINSPRQTVVSGEAEAVDSAVRAAGRRGIPAKRLPVSGAFHSRLVADAAEHFRNTAPIPDRLTADARVIAGFSGKPTAGDLDLPRHLAAQIAQPVDFISTVRTLASDCDLLLEVGPGKVLSGLVRDILGEAGPLCLPVESEPEADADLNIVLAEAFVRGVAVRFEELYRNRLVRPFVEAARRVFIENPCERPLKLAERDSPPTSATGQSDARGGDGLAASLGLPSEVVAEYIKRRGAFLGDVIRADLRSGSPGLPMASAPVEGQPAPIGFPLRDGKGRPASADAALNANRAMAPAANRTAEAILIQLAAERTGFDAAGISAGSRLLDDPNLDSIKAADLVASAAVELGVAGAVDPAALATATIGQAAAALHAAAATRSPSDAGQLSSGPTRSAEPIDVLLQLAAEGTGFARTSLTPDMRLLDDLNLDSIKSGELVARAAAELGVSGRFDPARFAQSRLSEVAEALGAARVSDRVQPRAGDRPVWVRDFAISLRPSPMAVARDSRPDRRTTVLILTEPGEQPYADALAAALRHGGAEVRLSTFAVAAPDAFAGRPVGKRWVFAFMPRGGGRVLEAIDRLGSDVARLRTAAILSAAVGGDGAPSDLAIVQWGGGGFGHAAALGADEPQAVGTAAFAASIHLERPAARVRVIDLSPAVAPDSAAQRIIDELSTATPFDTAGYDPELTRRTLLPVMLDSAGYRPRRHRWSKDDIVLATGGAKGITAECVLAWARGTGLRVALAGRSPHPDASGADPAVAETLRRFRAEGVDCRYYPCDVASAGAVAELVRRVRADMGPITAVVHGAGLNRPRRVEQVNEDDAVIECAPKVAGVAHLAAALDAEPPKMLVAFSSIIGVTGMAGNAWYAFANEAMDLRLAEFGRRRPDCSVLSMAFSVWSGAGMGERLGSTSRLGRMGIDAIPLEEGVRRFLRLVAHDPGERRIAVTARTGGLDTWRPPTRTPAPPTRFTERMVSQTPGVEAVARVRLSLEQDAYLRDHCFNGSHLFPTVFGLEAMAQVAARAADVGEFRPASIEDIRLERPVVVDAKSGTEIEIRAEAAERSSAEEPMRIRASVRCAQTGYQHDHFAATFVLGPRPAAPAAEFAAPADPPPDIVPGTDLYGGLLFQGPLFRRLTAVLRLADTTTLFEARSSAVGEAASSEPAPSLGDPFLRDVLLQSAQLLSTPAIMLPVGIERIELFGEVAPEGICRAQADLRSRTGDELVFDVVAADIQGRVFERLVGYRAKVIERRRDLPTPGELADPSVRDTSALQRELDRRCAGLGLTAPRVALQYAADIHKLSRERRHRMEEPVFRRAAGLPAEPTEGALPESQLAWEDSGRPYLTNGGGRNVSFSHTDRVCLCVVGEGPQGCDLAEAAARGRDGWAALLGDRRMPLFAQLTANRGEADADVAGSRIWAAAEAAYKALQAADVNLRIESSVGDSVLFAGPAGCPRFLTFPLRLTRGPRLVAAIAVRPASAGAPRSEGGVSDPGGFRVLGDGPGGRTVLEYDLPLAFREFAGPSRTLYFSHYLHWLGRVRELALAPLLERLADEFAERRSGAVTKSTEIRISGEARAGDAVALRLWLEQPVGETDTEVRIGAEWLRKTPNGPVPIAEAVQTTAWVAAGATGAVRSETVPAYVRKFLAARFPPHSSQSPSPDWPGVDPAAAEPGLGDLLQSGAANPKQAMPAAEAAFDVGPEHSDLVGNLNWSVLADWQGHVRDRTFRLRPGFGAPAVAGEFRCVRARLLHLREAMPFDRITVRMTLAALHERGVRLRFDYLRDDPDGDRHKIAYGEHDAVWFEPAPGGAWRPTPLPAVLRQMAALDGR